MGADGQGTESDSGAAAVASHAPVRTWERVIRRVVVLVLVLGIPGLAVIYSYDSFRTNAYIARLRDVPLGTHLDALAAQQGAPDRVDAIDGRLWRWGRRTRVLDDEVKRVAVYFRKTTPQVCTFMLDADDRVVEIEVFAGY